MPPLGAWIGFAESSACQLRSVGVQTIRAAMKTKICIMEHPVFSSVRAPQVLYSVDFPKANARAVGAWTGQELYPTNGIGHGLT